MQWGHSCLNYRGAYAVLHTTTKEHQESFPERSPLHSHTFLNDCLAASASNAACTHMLFHLLDQCQDYICKVPVGKSHIERPVEVSVKRRAAVPNSPTSESVSKKDKVCPPY